MTDHSFTKNKSRAVPVRCTQCKMLHAGLCSVLTADELILFDAMSSCKKFTAGQMIRMEEEPVHFYANVISGVAKMIKSTSDGRQQIVGLILPADFIDRVFIDISTCTIEAVTDMELCSYPKKKFEALVREDPDLEHRLFTLALHDLEMAEEWMLLLGRKTAREKVATFLLMLAERVPHLSCPHMIGEDDHSVGSESTIDIPMIRADIADYLGLTMETVCRQMTLLKKDGVIELPDNHCFTSHDLNRLRDVAGQEPSIDI